ncbi:SCO2523 family variant P-loop protein [Streptomyces chromofuscus]|uniref:ParA family protein n=1 Tax=Streptomyces chromofuscus TaxID=42881 RepID=A0A7M2T5X1_STRCW|nr:SCO2523 family variant P-loop protein [Streptomyces chromofuscus]QOV44077.1 ParA family protein [Streptomyces chromofuscus]GGT05803.1 DNA-binding protein [Streptomyces chromofuscus]
MIVFATSDKGGTGRSVTCANIAYRRALGGDDVAYVDFDFGSPTAATVFELGSAVRRAADGGVHSCLRGQVAEPARLDVWLLSEREVLRRSLAGAGRLCLVPGDPGGGEFPADEAMTRRCAALLLAMEQEFAVTIVDLSAGRSYAIDIALRTTARPEFRDVVTRWLVFHRWTRQHIEATAALVGQERGILQIGAHWGHDTEDLVRRIRYVRAAVPGSDASSAAGLRAEQAEWLRSVDAELTRRSGRLGLGRTATLGTVPLDPVLQWSEQLITDEDVLMPPIANADTVQAFRDLADALTDDERWQTL